MVIEGDDYEKNKNICELIRVLKGIHLDEPKHIELIVNDKERFLLHFLIKSAYKLGIVKFINNLDVPANFKFRKEMREEHNDSSGKFICGDIVDYNIWNRKRVDNLTK